MRRERLLDELLRVHEPLVRSLTRQLRGGKPPAHLARRIKNRMMVRGAKALPREVALNAARMALKRALEDYDPTLGGFAIHVKRKIYSALQTEVGKHSIVKVPQHHALPNVDLVAEDRDFGRIFAPASSHESQEDAVLALIDAQRAPVVHDDRPALVAFFVDECRFAPHARVRASTLIGRCERFAFARGQFVAREMIRAELRARGVRSTRIRDEWSDAAAGFAGVALRTPATSRTRPLQSRSEFSRASLASGHGG